jgi:predicted nucleic acid-binding protein
MKIVFVDTAGWMALADAADPLHAESRAARDAVLEGGARLVTTDFVADETLTLLRLRLGIAAEEAWWAQVDRSPRLGWERVDSDRFEKARALFFRHRDKGFSFTDCTSFAIMRELRLTRVITTDRHFRQMGFDVLPDSPASRRSRPRSIAKRTPGR